MISHKYLQSLKLDSSERKSWDFQHIYLQQKATLVVAVVDKFGISLDLSSLRLCVQIYLMATGGIHSGSYFEAL